MAVLYSHYHCTGDTKSLDFTGVLLRLAYRLRRYRWLGGALVLWLGLGLAGGAAFTVLRTWPSLWPLVPWAVLLLGYVLFLAWAARQQYVHFGTSSGTRALLQDIGSAPSLHVNEDVPVRASGWFHVEGRDGYFLDIEADFKTTATGEHIVMGRVHPSRFLLLGRWPKGEVGWWYVFCQPSTIQEVKVGYLHFGPRPYLALRVTYTPEGKASQAIYFTTKDAITLRRLQNHLQPGKLGEE